MEHNPPTPSRLSQSRLFRTATCFDCQMETPPPPPAYDIPHNKKKSFLLSQWNVMYFNLSLLPLVLSVGTTGAGSLFIASHQVFMHIDKITPIFLLSCLKSQPLLTLQMLQARNILVAVCQTPSCKFPSFLYRGAQNWILYSLMYCEICSRTPQNVHSASIAKKDLSKVKKKEIS